MSDITFSCPFCQNPLVVEDEGAGMEIPCPVCSREITIPEVSTPAPEQAEADEALLPELPVTEEELDRLAEEILRRTRSGDAGGGSRILKRKDGGRDIAFSCPQCSTRLVVDIAGAGVEIPCPTCETTLTIPDPVQDAESFLAAALASRLGKLGEASAVAEPAKEAPRPAQPSPNDNVPLPPGHTRIALKPKVRSKKPAETPAMPNLPFLMPQGAAGEGGLAGLTEEMVKAGAVGSGYMIVPIQTPNGPAAMITQAPKTGEDSASRKRPRYPRKYSELAAKLRSATPADGEALGELQKRGPLVSRLLAQHFIEKALEESGEVEKGDEDIDAPVTTDTATHKGALKSPRRVDLEGNLVGVERASRRVTGVSSAPATPEPTGALPASRQHHGRHRAHKHAAHHGGANTHKRRTVTAVAIIGGLVAVAVLIYSIKVDADVAMAAAHRPVERIPAPTEVGLKGEEAVFLPKLEQNTARAAVEEFARAGTWEELLPLVRQRDRMEPIMRKYYEERPYKPMSLQETRLAQANYNKGLLLVNINGVSDENDNYRELPFLLERTEDGQYLVDWEFVVEYNPYTWEHFRQLRPKEVETFRVLLTPADYYNFEFADSRIYQSFKIEDRETGFVGIYAFAKRDSEVAKRLEDEMRTTLPLPCMVKLKFPENGQGDTVVEITDWVRKGWMVLPE